MAEALTELGREHRPGPRGLVEVPDDAGNFRLDEIAHLEAQRMKMR